MNHGNAGLEVRVATEGEADRSGFRAKRHAPTGYIGPMRHFGLILGSFFIVSTGAAEPDLRFDRDVRPILSETCFHCHGPDEEGRAAGLRLDLAETAREDLGGYAAIVPGDRDASEAWMRMISDDPDAHMPPPDSHLTLTDEQRETLGRWIDQGAKYTRHWSLVSVRRIEPRPPHDLHPIDDAISRRLTREGVTPNGPADPATLVRRVTFDLTGLPPAPTRVQTFVDNWSVDPDAAYAALLDELFASPHFGERFALSWLDAARYADTNGYSIDGGRDMWLWRDWVIDSINRNRPVDEFITHQLAGDLIDDADDASRTATGFNRNHMITHEGGTIPEENLTNYAADRVKTVGEAMLGLTLGCAQCHDHKYDPISQRDYYRFFAFFNELSDRGLDGDRGVNAGPTLDARTVLATETNPGTGELSDLRRREAELQRSLSRRGEAFDDWCDVTREREATRGRSFREIPLRLLEVTSPNERGALSFDADGTVRVPNPRGWPSGISHRFRLPAGVPIDGLRLSITPPLPTDDDPHPNLTRYESGLPTVTAVLASAGPRSGSQVDYNDERTFSGVTASSNGDGSRPAGVLDPRNETFWRPADPKTPARLTLTLTQATDPTGDREMTVMVFFGHSHAVPHQYRITGFTGRDPDTALPRDVAEAFTRPRKSWDDATTRAVHRHYVATSDATRGARTELANVRERIGVLTRSHPTMVMNVADEPRKTHVLNRGQYDSPGEEVAPGVPAMLPPLTPRGGPDARADRLDLARWMTAPDHPLTARVFVNRWWSMLFGVGLVATEADFGSQGSFPSHPELLDHLASRLVDSGWDRKALIRYVVNSEAYRRDSAAFGSNVATDPANTLLWRGPRFRLPAEMVRDAALSYAGLLVPRIGGPSVLPYQPAGLWKQVSHFGSTSATRQVFVQDHGEKLYRRSLYTFVKRTSPHPAMAALDAPNRELCVIRRDATNTPVQALVTMNDPQFAEAARELARRVAGEDEPLEAMAAIVLSRPLSDDERRTFRRHFDAMARRYADDPDAARAVISVGESPIDDAVEPTARAAWTSVAAVMMNLSETITRR